MSPPELGLAFARSRAALVTLAASGWVVGVVAPAAAAETRRLELQRAPTADRCPDQTQLRDLVAERLGSNPFRPEAAALVRVQFGGAAGAYEAQVSGVGAGGEVEGQRTLTSAAGTCDELAASVVLTVSLFFEPSPAPTVGPAASASGARATTPAPVFVAGPPEAAAPAIVAPGSPWVPGVYVGAIAESGSAPKASLGPAVRVTLRHAGFSAALEGRVAWASDAIYTQGTVTSGLRTVSALACAHYGMLFGCPQATVGAVAVDTSGVADPRHVLLPYVAVGVRVGAELAVGARFFASAHVDLSAPLTRPTLGFGATDVWTMPDLALAAGIGAGLHFP